MYEPAINGVPRGLHLAVMAQLRASRALIEASTHASDHDACQIGVKSLSRCAEWLAERGLDDGEEIEKEPRRACHRAAG